MAADPRAHQGTRQGIRRCSGVVLSGVLLLASPALARTVDVAWDAPTSGAPPSGYTIYRKQPGEPLFELITSVDAEVLTWSDPHVGQGETCWHVTAWNDAGESVPSNTVCVVQGRPHRPRGRAGRTLQFDTQE